MPFSLAAPFEETFIHNFKTPSCSSTPERAQNLVCLPICVGLSIPAEAKTQSKQDLLWLCDLFFFSLNAQSESSCWHSLPWVLSPLTCEFALCLFVCWTQGALPPFWIQQPQAGWVSWGRADHGLLCVLQRSPRSAARTAMSSSSPSWTCGATRSTAAAPWGPCTRASVTRSSRKASEMDRSTSARTVRGCSPTNTGTHRHPDPPLASPLCPGQRGMMGETEGINLSFLHGNLSFLRRV